MNQQDASLILFLAPLAFTLIGNYIVGRVNAGRTFRHMESIRMMNELFDMARESKPGKKVSTRTKKLYDRATIEIPEPSMLGKFNFWLVLLMTIAAYSILSAMH
jgi:hypothetical protein